MLHLLRAGHSDYVINDAALAYMHDRSLAGPTIARLAELRFTVTNPDLDTTIVGTAHAAYQHDNVVLLQKGPLPADVYAEAERRVAEAGCVPRRA